MLRIPGTSTFLLLLAVLSGCTATTPPKVNLPPPELFTWTGGQPVSFSPPPGDWNRSRYQNGGAEGVDFVLAGSRGEMIFVAERFFLGKRDRCGRIREILENLNHHDRRTFKSALRKARLHAGEPLNSLEAGMVDTVNGALDLARQAYLADDMAIAHAELSRALQQAGTIRYTVEEAVDRVLFRAEDNPVYPALRVDDPGKGEVAGVPAVVVEFTFEGHRIPMAGRRIYVVKNNRMFEIGYQGLESNLPLFESILESMTFPPGPCEH